MPDKLEQIDSDTLLIIKTIEGGRVFGGVFFLIGCWMLLGLSGLVPFSNMPEETAQLVKMMVMALFLTILGTVLASYHTWTTLNIRLGSVTRSYGLFRRSFAPLSRTYSLAKYDSLRYKREMGDGDSSTTYKLYLQSSNPKIKDIRLLCTYSLHETREKAAFVKAHLKMKATGIDW